MNIITLNKEDKTYSNFLSFNISKDLENASGSFKFEASVSDLETFPFKVGDAIQVAIDGENFITGFIDIMSPEGSRGNHIINIEGRDKISDLIDSQIQAIAIKAPITMVDLISKVCKLVGYQVVSSKKPYLGKNNDNEISIINNYGDIEIFKERIDLRNGESGWNLIQKYAEKRQLVITCNGDGNIVINKIGSEKAVTILKNIKNEENNNIKNTNFSINVTNRFHNYIVKSNNTKSPESENDGYQVGFAYDRSIRKTRTLLMIAQVQMTSGDCQKKAEWEANIRKADSIKYCVEIFGFRQNLKDKISENPLWNINQLVYVKDSFAGINDEMLIKSINYSKTKDKGSVTKIELIDKLAYTLTLNEPKLRKVNKGAGTILYTEFGKD